MGAGRSRCWSKPAATNPKHSRLTALIACDPPCFGLPPPRCSRHRRRSAPSPRPSLRSGLEAKIPLRIRNKKEGVGIRLLPLFGRDDRIRTCGLFVPNEARYQTALHLDMKLFLCSLYCLCYPLDSGTPACGARPTCSLSASPYGDRGAFSHSLSPPQAAVVLKARTKRAKILLRLGRMVQPFPNEPTHWCLYRSKPTHYSMHPRVCQCFFRVFAEKWRQIR